MSVNVEELKDTAKGKRRKIVAAAITLSIVVHAIIGVGALYWIIARFFPPPEATFVSRPVKIPPKIIDPKVTIQELEAAAPRPVIDQKIASVREAKFALPDIPKVPVDMLEFDPTSLVSDQVSDVTSMMGGRGNSAAGMMGVEFFGLKATGQYIAFVVDLSESMKGKAKGGKTREALMREELSRAVKGLSPEANYALVFFAGPVWLAGEDVKENRWAHKDNNNWHTKDPDDAPKAKWIAATENNKRRSLREIEKQELVWGTDWVPALGVALAMKPPPDVIFFMTDGAEGKAEAEKGVKLLAEKAKNIKVNTIALGAPQAGSSLRDLAKQSKGGQFKQVD